MAITSRNDLERFTYFFVSKSVKRYLSPLPIIEFHIYKFDNPVSAERGKKYLKDEFTIDVYQMTEEAYKNESFEHPKYRNQKNQYIKFKYIDIPLKIVPVEVSRNIESV
jgi:hypothetical protein